MFLHLFGVCVEVNNAELVYALRKRFHNTFCIYNLCEHAYKSDMMWIIHKLCSVCKGFLLRLHYLDSVRALPSWIEL